MKGAALILFSAFALALSDEVELNANGCPVDFEVHKVLAHDTYCNLFYSCVGGLRTELRCPGELVFNAEAEVCDWRVNVDCGNKGISVLIPDNEEEEEINPGGNNDPTLASEICAREDSDGALVAHENCNKFYKCDRGLPVTLECPDNLLYNSILGICDWPVNVDCGDRVLPETISIVLPGSNRPLAVYEACANDKTNGLLLAHEHCNRFYKCSYGLPVAFSCPAGLLYNIEQQWCDWQTNVECGERPIVEDEVVDGGNDGNTDSESNPGGHGHSDPSAAPAICAAEKSEGVLVAHENCNQFYKCSGGLPVALNCPEPLLYNYALEACDWLQNVDCGSRIKSSK